MAKTWLVGMALTGLAMVQCQDETVSGYLQEAQVFQLTEMAGQAAPAARVTIDLSEPGRVFGRAPCNSYSAVQTAPYPWFELGPIKSTRAACPELQAEQRYFSLLRRMTLSEISGSVLILSNEQDESLVFRAAP